MPPPLPAEAGGRAAAEFYRSEAARILDLAERSRFLETRQTLIDTARLYEKLARHAKLMGMHRG